MIKNNRTLPVTCYSQMCRRSAPQQIVTYSTTGYNISRPDPNSGVAPVSPVPIPEGQRQNNHIIHVGDTTGVSGLWHFNATRHSDEPLVFTPFSSPAAKGATSETIVVEDDDLPSP